MADGLEVTAETDERRWQWMIQQRMKSGVVLSPSISPSLNGFILTALLDSSLALQLIDEFSIEDPIEVLASILSE